LKAKEGEIIRFRTELELGGKTATGFRVPAEVVEQLGRGQRPPVVVSIGSYTYRSTIAAYTGLYMLPLAAEHRERVGLKAGDKFEVGVELDTEPRIVEIPEPLAATLNELNLMRAFRSLSYSNQRRHAESVAGAKTDETRRRRIEKVVAAFRDQNP
jgi:hypothetical protein